MFFRIPFIGTSYLFSSCSPVWKGDSMSLPSSKVAFDPGPFALPPSCQGSHCCHLKGSPYYQYYHCLGAFWVFSTRFHAFSLLLINLAWPLFSFASQTACGPDLLFGCGSHSTHTRLNQAYWHCAVTVAWIFNDSYVTTCLSNLFTSRSWAPYRSSCSVPYATRGMACLRRWTRRPLRRRRNGTHYQVATNP